MVPPRLVGSPGTFSGRSWNPDAKGGVVLGVRLEPVLLGLRRSVRGPARVPARPRRTEATSGAGAAPPRRGTTTRSRAPDRADLGRGHARPGRVVAPGVRLQPPQG